MDPPCSSRARPRGSKLKAMPRPVLDFKFLGLSYSPKNNTDTGTFLFFFFFKL